MSFHKKYNLFGIPVTIVIIFLLGYLTGTLGSLLSVIFLFLLLYLLFFWVYALIIHFTKADTPAQNSFICYCALFPSLLVVLFLTIVLLKHGIQIHPPKHYRD